jgi:protoheme IX farnesyltransferase
MAVAEAVGPRRLELPRRTPILLLALASAAGVAMALVPLLRLPPVAVASAMIVQAALLLAVPRQFAIRHSAVVRTWPNLAGGLLSLIGLSLSTNGTSAALDRAGLLLAALPLLSTSLLAMTALRERRTRPAAAVLTVSSAALSAAFMAAYLSAGSAVLLNITAGLVWGALLAAILLRVSQPAAVAPPDTTSATWRDYLALTKPVIVVLLLVTTLAGMVVGAGEWPRAGLIAWTMLGGALSAGGASAMNQFIDRDLDRRMQRTQRRPFPSGRLGETEGLAFAFVLCVAGFYTLALAVNLLSALLSLAGMLYYVVLYSLVLKKTTTQNIVVGGGAGAIPPLVGWAATTGSLSMAAFFLFAVIFFWTPPHFWALALLRRKDYARAGIPMLPAVESERSTAWQILLYTVQLVALTLLLPLAGAGGALFLVSAAVFGAGFLVFAWRLWRQGGNRLAHGLYRYSSMYLALIFAALVVDTLVRA